MIIIVIIIIGIIAIEKNNVFLSQAFILLLLFGTPNSRQSFKFSPTIRCLPSALYVKLHCHIYLHTFVFLFNYFLAAHEVRFFDRKCLTDHLFLFKFSCLQDDLKRSERIYFGALDDVMMLKGNIPIVQSEFVLLCNRDRKSVV